MRRGWRAESVSGERGSEAVRQSLALTSPLTMFVVCQGTCFCAGKAEGFNRQKVLYCFGEVRES